MSHSALRHGVHSVVVTPFQDDERLDEVSVARVVDYYAEAGVAGILVLGVLGEADRLSDVERDLVQERTIEHAAARLQVTVGVTHPATRVAAERARSAEAAGAAAVMVSPPAGIQTGPVLRDHYRRIGDGLSIPIVVQDLPSVTGVRMPAAFLTELVTELPAGSVVKLEEPPTPAKTAELRVAAPTLQVYGGLGGIALIHELDAGSAGTMTGFALPHLLVEIVDAHQRGDRAHARRVFEEALPLLVFEAQPGAGVAVRKEILRRRGAIATATVRRPATRVDERSLAALDELLGGLASA